MYSYEWQVDLSVNSVSLFMNKAVGTVLNFLISVASYNAVPRRNMIFTTLVFFSKI